ncbi:MAG: porin family protein [Cytophagaceae bacterium]
MKKVKLNFLKGILASFAIIASLTASHAQSPEFAIGPKLGTSINRYGGTDNTTRFGFVGGAFATVGLFRSFAIQPEILYHNQSTRVGSNNQRVEMSFIEVPVLAKFRFGGSSKVQPHIFAGPSFAWNLSADRTTTADDGSAVLVTYNRNRTLGVIGAGIDVGTGRTFFTLDGRYGFGVDNSGNNQTTLQYGQKSFIVMAGIGYRFGGGTGGSAKRTYYREQSVRRY